MKRTIELDEKQLAVLMLAVGVLDPEGAYLVNDKHHVMLSDDERRVLYQLRETLPPMFSSLVKEEDV